MIDLHCHILPGLDDGPEHITESIAMARMAALDGITTIVATPHVQDRGSSPQAIQAGVDTLNRQLQEFDIPVTILRGADLSALLPPLSLRDHTINKTHYLLLEFPHTHLTRNAAEILFNIAAAGLHPIITHPERNPTVIMNPERLLNLLHGEALVQITADSLVGNFGPDIRECAVYLLKKGVVNIIASDAHSAERRKPVLSEGLRIAQKIVGRENALRMVTLNPEAVISGRPL